MPGKRYGTKLVILAGETESNVVTDPDGILIGLRIDAGGVDADLTFEEVIGNPRPVDPDDLVTVPLVLSDGVTAYKVHYENSTGGLIMVGPTSGAKGSPLPLKTYRIVSSATQTNKLTIDPVYQH